MRIYVLFLYLVIWVINTFKFLLGLIFNLKWQYFPEIFGGVFFNFIQLQEQNIKISLLNSSKTSNKKKSFVSSLCYVRLQVHAVSPRLA